MSAPNLTARQRALLETLVRCGGDAGHHSLTGPQGRLRAWPSLHKRGLLEFYFPAGGGWRRYRITDAGRKALGASRPCVACGGKGFTYPLCVSCDDSTEDHECPAPIECPTCRGTGVASQ